MAVVRQPRSVHAWYMYSSPPPLLFNRILFLWGVSVGCFFFSFIFVAQYIVDDILQILQLNGVCQSTRHVTSSQGSNLTRDTYPILLYLFNLTVLIYVFLLADARFISFLSISCIFHVGEDGQQFVRACCEYRVKIFYFLYCIYYFYIRREKKDDQWRKTTLKFVSFVFQFQSNCCYIDSIKFYINFYISAFVSSYLI